MFLERQAQSAVDDVSGQGIGSSGLDSQLEQLFRAMPHKLVQIEPRRPFRDPGAPRNQLILVWSGLLAKFKVDSGGRRQIVALRFPGEPVLPAEQNAGYGLQAIVRSEVMIANQPDFEAAVAEHGELQRFVWRTMQRNCAIGYEWLVNCGRRDSTARVAHLLCELALRSGCDVPREQLLNPFTQQQIAEITGQTSVNVNRILSDLERQGIIQRNGRAITVSDWEELRRMADFQPGYLQ